MTWPLKGPEAEGTVEFMLGDHIRVTAVSILGLEEGSNSSNPGERMMNRPRSPGARSQGWLMALPRRP